MPIKSFKIGPLLLCLVSIALLLQTPATVMADGSPTTCPHDPVAQLAGRIVLDIDHDNWPDANEGIESVTVLLRRGDTDVQTTTTDHEGCYRFNRYLLQQGATHRVSWSGIHASNRFIHDPDNSRYPGTQNYLFVAGSGQPAETDVVYRPASMPPYLTHCPYAPYSTGDLGGMVAIDHNQNHRADPGEGIPDTIVTLAVGSPDYIVAQDVTDINGCYRMPRDAQTVAEALKQVGISLVPDKVVYMFVRAYLPSEYDELVESYDPNGRQTAHRFYDHLGSRNGTIETDFLYRELYPSAVNVAGFAVNADAPPWPLRGMVGTLLTGAVVVGIVRYRR